MKTSIVSGDSIWAVDNPMRSEGPLATDATCDVCIVGGGIAGLSTAYLLARSGKDVVVIDDGPLAGGQTQVTTAHLSNAIDDRYSAIERVHGQEGARLAAESHTAAIEHIESIVGSEQIDCDFERVDGYLYLAPRQSRDFLEQEFDAARRTGVVQVEWAERPPIDLYQTPCLRFGNQAQFHPLRYLAGLARGIARDGGRLYSSTHAKSIQGGKEARVETLDGRQITADAVVVATNTPINDLVAIHTKQAPYRTYVIGAQVAQGAIPRGLYWDTLDPYHYARLQRDHGAMSNEEILLVGGEDHKTGQADDGQLRYERLEAWTREHFPQAGEIAFHWSGQVMETIDGLAFIGRNPLDEENVFIATGDSGMGMTHGTIAGILLTDLILGRRNAWASLYDPSRKPMKAMGHFARENVNVAMQYSSWLTPGEIRSLDELAPTCGAIMRRGLQKIAVYRDEKGQIHEMSATCPHLDCIVAWNAVEKMWDCPCHGSQFDCRGHVVNGPANRDLERLDPRPKPR